MDELTDEQKAMLDFERGWWRYAGAKESAILETFGIGSVTYYARLNALLSNPAALAFDPLLVGRLLRLRDARRAVRTAG